VNYHVVTTFSRRGNLEKLYAMLADRGAASWTLLGVAGEPPLTWHGTRMPIAFQTMDVPKGSDIRCSPLNQWMKTAPLVAEDRYCFICDDDWLPEGFFQAVNKDSSPLIIVSMKRGDVETTKGPAWTLIAARENLHYGHCGVEQGIVSGAALERYRATCKINLRACNEDVIFGIAEKEPTVFLPDVFVHFNYLEPGRWNH
jgi:hypothetical protein